MSRLLRVIFLSGCVIVVVAAAFQYNTREPNTNEDEACYRRGIELAINAFDDLRIELAVLAGKVQERGDRDGERAAIQLWASGLESILERRQTIIDAVEGISAPRRYREFHRLLIEWEASQNETLRKILAALRSGDSEFREEIRRLQAEQNLLQDGLACRLVEEARKCGLATP
jgi:hypothetical protein